MLFFLRRALLLLWLFLTTLTSFKGGSRCLSLHKMIYRHTLVFFCHASNTHINSKHVQAMRASTPAHQLIKWKRCWTAEDNTQQGCNAASPRNAAHQQRDGSNYHETKQKKGHRHTASMSGEMAWGKNKKCSTMHFTWCMIKSIYFFPVRKFNNPPCTTTLWSRQRKRR